MNNYISIDVYKPRSSIIYGDVFILNIPDELHDVGYEDECWESDSNLFEEYEVALKLQGLEKGLYRLNIKPYNEKSLNTVIRHAREYKKYEFFQIIDCVKLV